MAGELATLCDDLAAEHDALDAIVRDLDAIEWDAATPAAGWRVREQIAHLTYFDQMGTLAINDPDAFARHLEHVQADLDAFASESLARADDPPETLLRAWRDARAEVVGGTADDAARRAPAVVRTADVGGLVRDRAPDGDLGARHRRCRRGGRALPATDRLRHVAHLGVRTRGWSYAARGLDAPAGEVRVALTGPSGDEWTWGAPDAPDRVTGSALDFCLVVTQRRHVDDTDLVADGAAAVEWLSIAQAFAGGATRTAPDRVGLGIAAP